MSASAIIKQLKSPNPKTRYAAVRQAAKSKDAAFLKALSTLAESDPDDQVRKVAAKAEQYIRNANGMGDAGGAAAAAAVPGGRRATGRTAPADWTG